MATKTNYDQHNLLHQHFPCDCCLCKAEVRIAHLEKEIDNYKFITQFTPEQCRYLESKQKKLEKDNEELRKEVHYLLHKDDKKEPIEPSGAGDFQ